MLPKIIALEVDDTIWSGQLDASKFGKGRDASPRLEDNLEMISSSVVRDKTNHQNYITLFPDVPDIINDILVKGIKLAIVSRNSSRTLCDRALFHFQACDANGNMKPIITLVTYDEVEYYSKVQAFKKIQGWSQVSYEEMLLFDSSPTSEEVANELGVKVKLVTRNAGLGWQEYKDALNDDNPYDTPYYAQPRLGNLLGGGKFASTYDSVDDPYAVIKVMKYWTKELRSQFLKIYRVIKAGKPFKPSQSNDDQYLLMIALELRNLDIIGELKAPKPENFSGWFTMTKIKGTPLYKTPLYAHHPFSVPFQELIKTAFHLAVDKIEDVVRRYGLEHRDAHLANVYFTMQDDLPTAARLLDWGIAVLMKWDGKQYIRGNDIIVWSDSEAGAKYTPEEFRRYWITWMVKTEYEANVGRNSITGSDSEAFLKDLDWWFRR